MDFYTRSYHEIFDMIHFTGYRVIAEKPHVGQLSRIFPCTLDALDVLYHHAKFGEDGTIRASCRCENMVFVTMFLLSVML